MQATTFAALGEPGRLEIVELMRRRPFSVGDIAQTLGMRQPQVSKHLKVLREAGIAVVEPVGRQRIYYLAPAAFEELGHWAESFQALWEDRLDSLEDVLTAMQAARTDIQTTPDKKEGST